MQPRVRQHGCRISQYEALGQHYVVLENRSLRCTVIVSKGADLLELRYKPLDLDALARTTATVSGPLGQIDPMPTPRGSFLDHSYLGWQEVFPNGGDPCVINGATLGTHGEVALLPWSAEIVSDTEDAIAVRFEVQLRRTPFRLVREMRIEADRPCMTMHESITNEGEERLPYMWGHHPDFGPPLLAPGAVIDLPGGRVRTFQEDVARRRLEPERLTNWPTGIDIEGRNVRLDEVLGKAARTDDSFLVEEVPAGWAALRNPDLDLGIALGWDTSVFPYLWMWQSWGGSFGWPHYGRIHNLAMEPFSSPHGSLADNMEAGTARYLDSGASLETALQFSFFRSASSPIMGPDDPRLAGS